MRVGEREDPHCEPTKLVVVVVVVVVVVAVVVVVVVAVGVSWVTAG